jgi:hypothetical protein
MAAHAFECLMGNNDLWAGYKKSHPGMSSAELEKLFVRQNAHHYIPMARAQLASMLGMPGVAEETKEAIHEALVLDNSLVMGRANPAEVVGTAAMQ